MKKASSIVCSFLFILGPIALGSRLGASQTGPAMPDDVKAIFKEHCAVCHKGKYPPQHLNLEPEGLPASLLDAPSREQPALKLVDTASPEGSYLLKKIKGSEGITGKSMPPPGKAALTGDEIALIENWIMGLKEDGPAIAFKEVGFEKKIGGHVFQLLITNSIGLTSAQFVTGGDLRLGKGDLRFGFNIFRTF